MEHVYDRLITQEYERWHFKGPIAPDRFPAEQPPYGSLTDLIGDDEWYLVSITGKPREVADALERVSGDYCFWRGARDNAWFFTKTRSDIAVLSLALSHPPIELGAERWGEIH